jgi:hypothetical protein
MAAQSLQLGTTAATSLIVLPSTFNGTDQIDFTVYGGQPMFMLQGSPGKPYSCSAKEAQLTVDNICIRQYTEYELF